MTRYTDSPLVTVTHISPNRNSPREHAIDTVSVHCTAGPCTAESLGALFASPAREASSNYGIGSDGSVGLYVRESDRSWCTSHAANDHRAVTVEVSSDSFEPYRVTDATYARLLDLLEDVCRRNGKRKLLWFGDKETTLAYTPKEDEMVMTVHRWFDRKSCPGAYLYERHGEIAEEVTRRLADEERACPPYRVRRSGTDAQSQIGAFSILENAVRFAKAHPGYAVFDGAGRAVFGEAETGVPYTVRAVCDALNIRDAPTVRGRAVGQITDRNLYTVVEEAAGEGSARGWGRLRSGAGWIALDWTERAEESARTS